MTLGGGAGARTSARSPRSTPTPSTTRAGSSPSQSYFTLALRVTLHYPSELLYTTSSSPSLSISLSSLFRALYGAPRLRARHVQVRHPPFRALVLHLHSHRLFRAPHLEVDIPERVTLHYPSLSLPRHLSVLSLPRCLRPTPTPSLNHQLSTLHPAAPRHPSLERHRGCVQV